MPLGQQGLVGAQPPRGETEGRPLGDNNYRPVAFPANPHRNA